MILQNRFAAPESYRRGSSSESFAARPGTLFYCCHSTFKLDGVGEFTMFRTPDLLLGKKKYFKDPLENVITDVISFRLIQGDQILNDLLLSKMTLIPGYGSDVTRWENPVTKTTYSIINKVLNSLEP